MKGAFTLMEQDLLLIIDMQKDFIDGSLGTREAEAIVAAVVKRAE